MIYISMQFFGGRGSSGRAAGGGGGSKAVVYKEINDGKEANQLFESSFLNWQGAIDEAEEKSVVKYTGSYYEVINGMERQTYTYSEGTIAEAKIHSSNISSAISKFELADNIVTYRGVDLNAFGLKGGDNIFSPETIKGMESLVGTTFVDKGFMSTSPVKSSAFDSDVRMIINVPKGKGRGAWVKPISKLKHENEFLLQKGSGLKISKVTQVDGIWEIQADLVGNNA